MKSMTGFGRGEAERDGYRFTVEIKTVNHRYFEPSIRLGRQLAALESNVRNLLKETIVRGKTDVFITFVDHSDKQGKVTINEPLLESYITQLRAAAQRLELRDTLCAGDILRLPDVMTQEDNDEDAETLWPILKEAMDQALERLNAMRVKEGAVPPWLRRGQHCRPDGHRPLFPAQNPEYRGNGNRDPQQAE